MTIPKLNLFWEYPDFWASNDPDFPMLKFKNQIITAKEIKYKTDKLAKAFLAMGLKKGDTIVTILPTIPEYVYIFIASSKIGAITIPMDKEYKKADFKLLIPHSNPKIIITIDKWQKNNIADNLQEIKEEFKNIHFIIVGNHELGTNFEELINKELNLDNELEKAKINQNPEDCILVVWTGGTTGAPKAVELTHKNIVEMCYLEYKVITSWLNTLSGSTIDRYYHLVNLPVSHVGGTVELLGTGLLAGFRMILQATWSPWDSLAAIKEYQIPFMGGVPTMFKILLSLPDLERYEPKKNLKLVILSGEKVSLDLLQGIKERISESIIIGYGSTEAGAEVTFTDLNDDFEKIAKGYVGKPLPGMDVIIIDDKGYILPPNKVGEVLVKGTLTSKSYFKMPRENKLGFNEEGYCKTGDLGYIDHQRGLYITGRIKEIIRVGAYTVLPAEVEELVLPHPKIAIAAAIGAPDDIQGEVVWLVLGPELGVKFEESDKQEIFEICQRNLAKYKVPRKIIIYPLDPNNLPITRIGKVDRMRLKKELIPSKK